MVHWKERRESMNIRTLACLCAGALAGLAQTPAPAPVSEPPISLEDALARARQFGGQIQSANLAAQQAREDSVQARAAKLPTVNAFNQFIYTEGNGTPSGVFVANDGVHIYNEQAVVHEELLTLVRHGEVNRALAAEAIARAKVAIASRGLNVTVIQDYFAIVSCATEVHQRADERPGGGAVRRHHPEAGERRRGGARRRDQGANRFGTAPAGSEGGAGGDRESKDCARCADLSGFPIGFLRG